MELHILNRGYESGFVLWTFNDFNKIQTQTFTGDMQQEFINFLCEKEPSIRQCVRRTGLSV